MPMGLPSPISWAPSQSWDGTDGSWSSFFIRVGTPEQIFRTLISTAGTSAWIVKPSGCPKGNSPYNCVDIRGGVYNYNKSSSWKDIGEFALGPNEIELGYNDAAEWGFDTVALGGNNATGTQALEKQVVAAFESYDFAFGSFGISDHPTNFTNFTDPQPSFLSSLHSEKLIPSLSWGYTAGARYQSKGVLGSLTLGGYDSSRMVPNDVNFPLADDVTRDLVVGVQSITASYENGTAEPLLPDAIFSFIDSTLPFIWLPKEACDLFVKILGIKWNKSALLYEVSDQLHQELLDTNPTFTFRIGNSKTGGPTVEIKLPYASFDLTAKPPFLASETRYFPILPAANDSQYTLGRSFLQEAYLSVNYEYSNFSLYQAKYTEGAPSNIIALPSTSSPSDAPPAPPQSTPQSQASSHKNYASVVGVSVGAGVLLIALLILFFFYWRSRGKRPGADGVPPEKGPTRSSSSRPLHLSGTHEISTGSTSTLTHEVSDTGKLELLDKTSLTGSGKSIYEMAHSKSMEIKVSEMPAFPPTPHRCSLRSSVTTVQREKKGRGIFVSQRISRETTTTIDSSTDAPTVATSIHASSSTRSKLSSAFMSPTTPEYLNRPLPPDPPSPILHPKNMF